MIVIDSEDIRSKYDDIVDKCKESGQPIYLSRKGQVELVAMDVSSFEKREQELIVQQLVLESFAARLSGEKDYSLSESKELIKNII